MRPVLPLPGYAEIEVHVRAANLVLEGALRGDRSRVARALSCFLAEAGTGQEQWEWAAVALHVWGEDARRCGWTRGVYDIRVRLPEDRASSTVRAGVHLYNLCADRQWGEAGQVLGGPGSRGGRGGAVGVRGGPTVARDGGVRTLLDASACGATGVRRGG